MVFDDDDMELYGEYVIDSLEEDIERAKTNRYPMCETQGYVANIHSGRIPLRVEESQLDIAGECDPRFPRTLRKVHASRLIQNVCGGQIYGPELKMMEMVDQRRNQDQLTQIPLMLTRLLSPVIGSMDLDKEVLLKKLLPMVVKLRTLIDTKTYNVNRGFKNYARYEWFVPPS